MLKKIFICSLMTVVSAGSLFAANLFQNSGFETNTNGWSISKYDTSVSATLSTDAAGVKFGAKYGKITITKINADSVGNNWYLQLWEPTWKVKPNVAYTYTFWGKSGDSASHPVHIAATGKEPDSEYVYRDGKPVTFTPEWQQFQYSYTWTDNSTKAHFRLFIGGSKGILCVDSMYLDSATPTAAKMPLSLANHQGIFNYDVQLLPSCMRIVLANSSTQPNNVAIYSIGGRLLSSQTIPAATQSFELPKPTPGAWVVKVNSEEKVIQVR